VRRFDATVEGERPKPAATVVAGASPADAPTPLFVVLLGEAARARNALRALADARREGVDADVEEP
jgi:tRNA(Arg) A34 adenosine deaminase TadA